MKKHQDLVEETLMESEASHLQPIRSKSKRSKLSMHNSSFKIPILPAELIIEILLRLPVKSLVKFKCVSKSWHCLISSRKFIKTHLNISANNKDCTHHRLIMRFNDHPYHNLTDCSVSSFLYDSVCREFHSDYREFHLDYPMKNPHKPVLVLGSANGLICFSIEGDLILWNPSIKKFKKIPNSRCDYYSLHGFGYDQLHDDYKILGIDGTPHHKRTRIYSSNSDSWRIMGDDTGSGGIYIKWEGIFVNGKFHWAKYLSQDRRSYNGWCIASIDVTDGKCGEVEKPSYGEGDFHLTICVGVLGSDLSVLCNNQSTQTDVWIMEEYGIKESWTKMCTINCPHERPNGNIFDFCPFFCMSNKGEILFAWEKANFMIYNPKDDSIRYEMVTNYDFFSDVNIYIESLVWPFCQKERMQRWVQQLRRLKKQPRMERTQRWMQQLQKLKKLRRNQLCF